MMPDVWFVGFAAAVFLVALVVAARAISSRSVVEALGALFWALFGSGLLVQALAPRLRVEKNAFVVPESMASQGRTLDPVSIVNRERRMQTASALLVLVGAAGLGWRYRRAFQRERNAPSSGGDSTTRQPASSLELMKGDGS